MTKILIVTSEMSEMGTCERITDHRLEDDQIRDEVTLLTLPLEIRGRIYEIVLGGRRVCVNAPRSQLQHAKEKVAAEDDDYHLSLLAVQALMADTPSTSPPEGNSSNFLISVPTPALEKVVRDHHRPCFVFVSVCRSIMDEAAEILYPIVELEVVDVDAEALESSDLGNFMARFPNVRWRSMNLPWDEQSTLEFLPNLRHLISDRECSFVSTLGIDFDEPPDTVSDAYKGADQVVSWLKPTVGRMRTVLERMRATTGFRKDEDGLFVTMTFGIELRKLGKEPEQIDCDLTLGNDDVFVRTYCNEEQLYRVVQGAAKNLAAAKE